MEIGKNAKRVTSYLWLTSGIMLLGMFEAFYRDSTHELPQMDLSLGGCLQLYIADLDDAAITCEADLHYSDSTYLPDAASLSIVTPNAGLLEQINPSFAFDGECIAEVTHPIADAIKYSFLLSIVLSATTFLAEIATKKDNFATILSTYVWLTAGAMSIGVFDAFYRNTLHQLPNMDLSLGGCIVAGPGNYPQTIEPSILELSYDSEHYPPKSATVVFNPMKEFSDYQPTFFFRKECIAQITEPFGKALEISFFVAMGLSAGLIIIEQWIKHHSLSNNKEQEDMTHSPLRTNASEDESDTEGDLEIGTHQSNDQEVKNVLMSL